MSTLISIVVACVILGLLYWLLEMLPIAEPFRTIIRVVVVLGCILWLLSLVGWLPTDWRFR